MARARAGPRRSDGAPAYGVSRRDRSERPFAANPARRGHRPSPERFAAARAGSVLRRPLSSPRSYRRRLRRSRHICRVRVTRRRRPPPYRPTARAPACRFCWGIRTGSSGIMRSAVAIGIGTTQASDACRQREYPRPRSESAGEAPPIPGASSTQVPADGRRGRPIGCGSPASTKGVSSLPTAAPLRRPSPPARPPRGSVVLGGPIGSAAPVGWVVDRSRVPGHTSKS